MPYKMLLLFSLVVFTSLKAQSYELCELREWVDDRLLENETMKTDLHDPSDLYSYYFFLGKQAAYHELLSDFIELHEAK